MSGSATTAPPLSNGAHAHQLLEKHCQRLVALHGPVLKNRDPEPLHQMRVALRRLRACLEQFGPALDLPEGVGEQSLAKSVRRLGMARDLDVLRQRLEEGLMPQLPALEISRLKPALKELRRQRRQAQEQLQEVLNSSRHLRLIARLQRWLRAPRFTALGEEPLEAWLLEWQWPCVGTLLLHRGWRLPSPQGEESVAQLHALRKEIKGARYRLENLQPTGGGIALDWINQLKRGQELLGDLNDLAVLRREIEVQTPHRLPRHLPALDALLQQQRQEIWQQWRLLAATLVERGQRSQLVQGLLAPAKSDQDPDPGHP